MHFFNDWQDKWLVCLGVSVCALALMVWPDALADFRYDRAALLAGQWWRIVTGHLVHLNAAHLAFNLFGLFLMLAVVFLLLAALGIGAAKKAIDK